MLAFPFCLEITITCRTGSCRKYLFSCTHDTAKVAFSTSLVLGTWKTLRKCLVREWLKRKEWMLGERQTEKKKREGKVKEEMEEMRLGMGWVQSVRWKKQLCVASAFDIFSLWKNGNQRSFPWQILFKILLLEPTWWSGNSVESSLEHSTFHLQ